MNINEIRIEKLLLLLLSIFGIILFVDYTFGISNLLYIDEYIKLTNLHKEKLYKIIFSLIVPFVYFIDRNEYEKIKSEEKNKIYIQNITALSLQPFMLFIIGIIIYDNNLIIEFSNINKIITIISVQFLIQISILDIIGTLTSKIIKSFITLHQYIFKTQSIQKSELLELLNNSNKTTEDFIKYVNDNIT